ncbi:MAG: sulfatase-like hydrolase/transferase [Lachnospiraceae bacterium]|nr:sulfatase-like hydrolase/transferase [Lachnospiraceae bacterium]
MADYKQYKDNIIKKLDEMRLEEASRLIKEYETMAPMDMDLITLKCQYYMCQNNPKQALHYALLGVRRYPTSGDMHYNAAVLYEMMEQFFQAGKCYAIAWRIYTITEEVSEQISAIQGKITEIENIITSGLDDALQNNDKDYIQKAHDYLELKDIYWGKCVNEYRHTKQIIGKHQWINDCEKKYVAMYGISQPDGIGEGFWDLLHSKGEFQTVTEDYSYRVNGDAEEYLLPIAASEGTIHHFYENGQMYPVFQEYAKRFNYYRMSQGSKVISNHKSYYGCPIPLGHSSNRKRLVLNIFVDGLAQEIIDGEDFGKIMPNTYKYFSKGTICTQAYSTAEWTYPSIANIVTGVDTVHHMLFHDKIDGKIPVDIPTLAEYFKKAGYYTAHLTGNWRIIPSYGHSRGYDRFVYQHTSFGYKADKMIADTIEQLEGFAETDQFVWICLEDLHDIADELDLPIGVQSDMELSSRVIEAGRLSSATSVKQMVSPNKVAAYKKMATHLDTLLNLIYTYIQANYVDDEVIVSLFADHGQGYLIPENGEFLGKERERIAFMFRGDCKEQISDEIVSSSDYICIMCSLANITMKSVQESSNLPICFGGNKEREYALSESLHPHDPYRATFFAKDYTVYFENSMPVQDDGRFKLKNWTIKIEDKSGHAVADDQLYGKYEDIVMEHIAPLLVY